MCLESKENTNNNMACLESKDNGRVAELCRKFEPSTLVRQEPPTLVQRRIVSYESLSQTKKKTSKILSCSQKPLWFSSKNVVESPSLLFLQTKIESGGPKGPADVGGTEDTHSQFEQETMLAESLSGESETNPPGNGSNQLISLMDIVVMFHFHQTLFSFGGVWKAIQSFFKGQVKNGVAFSKSRMSN